VSTENGADHGIYCCGESTPKTRQALGRRPGMVGWMLEEEPALRTASTGMRSAGPEGAQSAYEEVLMGASLEGKAIIVTGAGRGLGAAYARLAARCGASIVVNDVDAAVVDEVVADIRADGGTACASVADVSTWDGSAALIKSCIDAYGQVDGLVNNAGVQSRGFPWEIDPVSAERMVRINVLGTIYAGTHALAAMREAGHGSLVNVTSAAQMGMSNMSVYGATKGAVASLTHCWAIDLAGTGVRVNAISPLAATQLAHDSYTYAQDHGIAAGDFQALPAPDGAAAVVAYLLSDDSVALNGQIVRFDGRTMFLVTHPSIIDPGISREEWTPTDVAQAFAGGLVDTALPLGVKHTHV
jgi:NAD(P)-dependent dehydrogenase (short-subunit alcohol dehydrogenase family)